jgi:hypothetical protein
MLEAYVIPPDQRKRALKCSGCELCYSIKDYDLLYSNQKLIYFKFKLPPTKRSKIYCHECILKAMAASDPAKEELKIKIITQHWEFICTYYPNEIDGDAEDFFSQIFK